MTTQLKRTDVHRPSAIDPQDYELVCITYPDKDEIGAGFQQRENMEIFNAHREITGGKFSQHEHGGSCHICGSWAIYLAVYYHRPTNSYIHAGLDCADKMEMGDLDKFRHWKKILSEERKSLKNAHEAALQLKAGKAKARAILSDAGFDSFLEMIEDKKSYDTWAEDILNDMVRKLVQYGNWSQKQWAFAEKLKNKILNPPPPENTSPCPVGAGQTITGEVISVKPHEGFYGTVLKMIVKNSDGWKVWGSVPKSISNVQPGSMIELIANVSKGDNESFGFFKNPKKARILEP